MENQDDQQPENVPFPPSPDNRPKSDMKIVGLNLLIMVAYTILFRISGTDGIILDAFIVAGHAILCVLIAPFAKKWEWAIAGILVAAVGLATCAGAWLIHS